MTLSPQFTFAQFATHAPLTADSIWAYILDRHAERSGGRRHKRALENLERIFLATFRLANDVGFRAMTLRHLCQETGLSMGGLYGYIDSKDQLAEMIEDVVRHASMQLPLMFDHLASPVARLEALARAIIYQSEILQPWFYFVYMDSRVLSVEQRNMAKTSELHVQSQLAALIGQIVARPPGSAELLASHCLALLQDWYVKQWKYRTSTVGVDEFADSTISLIRIWLSADSAVMAA